MVRVNSCYEQWKIFEFQKLMHDVKKLVRDIFVYEFLLQSMTHRC